MARRSYFTGLELGGVLDAKRNFRYLQTAYDRGSTSSKEFERHTLKAAHRIQWAMRSKVGYKTGRTFRAIRAMSFSKGPVASFVAVDYRISKIAHLLEYGTVKMPAQPFFQVSIDETADDVRKLLEKGAENSLMAKVSGLKVI